MKQAMLWCDVRLNTIAQILGAGLVSSKQVMARENTSRKIIEKELEVIE